MYATINMVVTSFPSGAQHMSREQKSNKETKKKAALSPKEKKAAKKARKKS
jgi:hypothetical protein